MRHVIAISNQKGGVGKTTTAVNLSAGLAARGHATLLIDLDPQANATSACGLDPNNLEASIYDCLIDSQTPRIYSLNENFPNLSILPASIDLAGAELELMDRDQREFRLNSALSRMAENFDFLILDTPPSLGLLALNALVAADWVLVPVQAEYLALEGLSRMILTIQRIKKQHNERLELLGIVTTLYDGRTNLSRQVIEELRRVFPDKVLGGPIHRSVRLSEAPGFGKPIIYYDPHSIGAEEYGKLTEEVIHACEKASIGTGA